MTSPIVFVITVFLLQLADAFHAPTCFIKQSGGQFLSSNRSQQSPRERRTTSTLLFLDAELEVSAASVLATWQPFVALALRTPAGMGIGVKTAQFLMDSKRQLELKRELAQKYPKIPSQLIDMIIDRTAEGFTTVAPAELKEALKPGAADKVMPALQKQIVDRMFENPVLKSLPLLASKDKSKLEGVVAKAIDYVLKDAKESLAAPEIRLDSLKSQQREIQKEMGFRRLTIYRFQNYWRWVVVGVAGAVAVVHQLQYSPLVISGTASCKAGLNYVWIRRKLVGIFMLSGLILHQLQFAPLFIWTKRRRVLLSLQFQRKYRRLRLLSSLSNSQQGNNSDDTNQNTNTMQH